MKKSNEHQKNPIKSLKSMNSNERKMKSTMKSSQYIPLDFNLDLFEYIQNNFIEKL
jgi:hypothetical protein